MCHHPRNVIFFVKYHFSPKKLLLLKLKLKEEFFTSPFVLSSAVFLGMINSVVPVLSQMEKNGRKSKLKNGLENGKSLDGIPCNKLMYGYYAYYYMYLHAIYQCTVGKISIFWDTKELLVLFGFEMRGCEFKSHL